MFKKIMNPVEEIQYKLDSIDNKYLINEGSRALGMFGATKGMAIPTQLTPQDICLYMLEGNIEVIMDEKIFNMKKGELILIPKTSSFNINFIENSKLLTARL